MSQDRSITFVSHTNKPGGAELGLRRYLEATSLPVRLVTMEADGVWLGLQLEVQHAEGIRGLRRALRDAELVVANSMRAAFLTALVAPRSARLVYYVQDGLTNSAMSPLALGLTKHVTARRTHQYVANSEWTAKTVQVALGVKSERVNVVYSMSGVTEAMLDRPPRETPHTPLRMLFLGRISQWKAPDVAIRALAPLRDLGIVATLTIAGGSHFGEDEYAAHITSLASEEPGVTILGHVDDVSDLLQSHDILVHCSMLPEPFGQVVIQAAGTGMPVLATEGGGPAEILDNAPLPLLYQRGDPVKLALAVQNAMKEYEALSAWCLHRAKDYVDLITMQRMDTALTLLQDDRRRAP